MTSRYVITLTDQLAAEMESWLGRGVWVAPPDASVMLQVSALDAITDEEYQVIAKRLRSGGPLYHHGGPR